MRVGLSGAVALVVVVAAVLAVALTPGTARADSTITVSGACTLPEAVQYADGSAEPDCAPGTASGTTTINLPAGTYTLDATLNLYASANIVGAGAASTVISGNNAVEPIGVDDGTVAISGVTVTDGFAPAGDPYCTGSGSTQTCAEIAPGLGGAIYNNATLTLTDDVFSDNRTANGYAATLGSTSGCSPNCPAVAGGNGGSAGGGGAIDNGFQGVLTVTRCVFTDNATGSGAAGGRGRSGSGTDASAGQKGGNGGFGGSGGAIDSVGDLTVVDSTFTGNVAGASGAGGPGTVATKAKSVGGDAGDPATGAPGGAISSGTGTLTISRSTFSGNRTGAGGAGATGGAGSGGAADGGNSYGVNGGSGGAVSAVDGGTTSIGNSTFTGNATAAGGSTPGGGLAGDGGEGGAIFDLFTAMQVRFDTIALNTAAGPAGGLGGDDGRSDLTESDSIIASNSGSGAKNCYTGEVQDGGGNITYGDASCPGTSENPKLTALADNGGQVETMALQASSPALNAIAPASCAATVDGRGVARPFGSGCDVGAYEAAAPLISGLSAGTPSADGATLTASINPDGSAKDTSVTVAYGTTSAYGSTTSAVDLGHGVGAVAFTTTLSGLTASTTYHYAITATNGDGTTTSADSTFTTGAPGGTGSSGGPSSGGSSGTGAGSSAGAGGSDTVSAPLTISGAPTSVSQTTLSVTINCTNSATTCSGPLTLTSHVTRRGTQVTAVKAMRGGLAKRTKPKLVTRDVIVGSGRYSARAGHTVNTKLTLNRTGRALLAARYVLPTTLVTRGTLSSKRTVTFRYVVLKPKLTATFFVGGVTEVRALIVKSVPARASVTALCHGRGCPFASRRFTVSHGRAVLSAAFTRRELRPGASVTIRVLRSGAVGDVLTYTVRAGAKPRFTRRCFVPGARRASICVR